MIGQRLLRIGSLLLKSPVTNGVAVARAAQAESVDACTLAGWVMEEAEKRGVSLSPEYASRIVAIASRKPRTRAPSRLAIVTCHFNPAGYIRLRQNYLRFLHHISWFGVPVFSAEVAFEGQDFPTSNAYLQIRGSANNVMWQKERLINLVADYLPSDYDCVAWIDADLLFLDPDWTSKAVRALATDPVVQLWNQCHGVDAGGRVYEILSSVGPNAHRYTVGDRQCPGGAWAAWRNIFPIYDAHIVGSGDATTVEGWTNLQNPKCFSRMNGAMQAHFSAWAEAAYRKVRGRVAVLPGDISHMHHGSRFNRRYVERWQPLIESGFDPAIHIELDDNGLYRWSATAPMELRHHVSQYFLARQEDG